MKRFWFLISSNGNYTIPTRSALVEILIWMPNLTLIILGNFTSNCYSTESSLDNTINMAFLDQGQSSSYLSLKVQHF